MSSVWRSLLLATPAGAFLQHRIVLATPLVRSFAVVPGVEAPVTSHLSFVPMLLAQTLKPGDVAVDATAGNGYDTLTLARLVLAGDAGSRGRVVSVDVQQKALDITANRLLGEFSKETIASGVAFVLGNHRSWANLTEVLGADREVKAWVYNLGYLPGGDKAIVTQTEDTLASLRGAAARTARGGLVCATCYRGPAHDAETAAVRAELAAWAQTDWRVCEFAPLNWPASPVVLTAHRFEVREIKIGLEVCLVHYGWVVRLCT